MVPTSPTTTRHLAEQALSRAAGVPLLVGNKVDLLIDAQQHFGAWLTTIRGARYRVLVENYILRGNDVHTLE